MPRATEKYLREQVEEMKKRGHNVALKFQNGFVKLVEPQESGYRDITHPMKNGELALWLDAYRRGYYAKRELTENQRAELQVMLWDSLLPDFEHEDRRVTGWGTKTIDGLLKSIARVVYEEY